MSIGKKLLALRQSKGLSQEELGKKLHVSRQTISKYESDLSLPDMKMMLEISDFYQVSITELLGIDEDIHTDSIERMYEQISLVLKNLQKENKKRVLRDRIVIGICILTLCFSIASLMKDNNNQVVSEPYPYYFQDSGGSSDNERVDYQKSAFEISFYDFEKMMITTDYQCVLKKYKQDTVVDFWLTPLNQENAICYPMIKENEYTFTLKETIPLMDYQNMQLAIKQDGETEMISLNESSISYMSNIVSNLVKVYIPCNQKGRLISDKIIYLPDYELLKSQGYNYSGKLAGDLMIKLDEIKEGLYENQEILNESISLKEEKSLKLDNDIDNGMKLQIYIECTIGNWTFEITNNSKEIQTYFGQFYNEYILYKSDWYR